MKKCCVTGHRPQTLNLLMKYQDFNDISFMDYNDAVYVTVLEALKDGFDYFISGGAIGVDLDFAEAVIKTKEHKCFTKEKKIEVEIAVPCDNQDLKWRPADKERYHSILLEADKVTLLGGKYTFNCMQKRNEYMVDNSEKVFAFWNGEKKGGTWNTIQYAKSKSKEVEIIDLRKICKGE